MNSKPYHETYRARFHFTADRGWINDPNGLIFHNGVYHLFFQHYPHSTDAIYEAMHWGHAVSSDLVRWKQMPIALEPDHNGACWSGSIVLDKTDSSGFGKGTDPVMVAAYTGQGHGQCLAYSSDGGYSWTKYADNPVIPFFPDRDPRIIWHGPSGKWVMVLYVEKAARSGEKGTAFFSSDDLKNWSYLSEVSGFYECPDFFELPVEGTEKRRWILVSGNGEYLIGDFDGCRFLVESGPFKGDFGANFYATQTWAPVPGSEERRIQIAWMNGGVYPEMPFNQQLSFPCELALRECHGQIKLCRTPVKEIESLYRQEHRITEHRLTPGSNPLVLAQTPLLDISLNAELAEHSELVVEIRGNMLRYETESGKLSFMGKELVIEPIDSTLRLRILLDITSVEIFANRGEIGMSFCFVAEEGKNRVTAFAQGADAVLKNTLIREIKSIWE